MSWRSVISRVTTPPRRCAGSSALQARGSRPRNIASVRCTSAARALGRARSWYQSAAEKGNVKAMHNLAVTASARDGGAADYALAAKWYGEAASYGLADSQFNLGILAEYGHRHVANPDADEVAAKAEWGEDAATSSGAQKENVALVSRAQALLNKLGYDAGSADGVMGERTRAAIRSFERKTGLKETGDVTVPLVTQLERAAG